jgi:tRNA A37 threonylcarbamoyladenosine synthetase subunit TsaC/SUA5/YrdC
MVIDGGFIYPEVSTVVRIEDDEVEVLREGKGSVIPLEPHLIAR